MAKIEWKTTRRYSRGENDVYDKEYLQLRQISPVINPQNISAQNFKYSGLIPITNKWQAKQILLMLEGDENGKCEGSMQGQRIKARKQTVTLRLKQATKAIADYKQKRINEGFDVPTADEIPQPLMNDLHKFEAQWDVVVAEIDGCKQLLKKFEEEEKVEHSREVLKRGLRGNYKKKDGILSVIDGQRVSVINKILVIDDKFSPYDGMKVVDYRRLAKEWRKKREDANKEAQKVRDEEARKYGHVSTPLPYSRLSAVKHSSLPAWPEWAENVKRKELIRTK